MKRIVLALACLLAISNTYAKSIAPTASEINVQNVNTVDNAGEYHGKSIPIKMNGKNIVIGSIMPCESNFYLDQSGILIGSMVVPVVGHSFDINSTDYITGIGKFNIEGLFNKKNGQSKTIKGYVEVTKLGNNTLEFKCVATLDGDPNSESIFTFSGTRK